VRNKYGHTKWSTSDLVGQTQVDTPQCITWDSQWPGSPGHATASGPVTVTLPLALAVTVLSAQWPGHCQPELSALAVPVPGGPVPGGPGPGQCPAPGPGPASARPAGPVARALPMPLQHHVPGPRFRIPGQALLACLNFQLELLLLLVVPVGPRTQAGSATAH
jgi:hypothetical protein